MIYDFLKEELDFDFQFEFEKELKLLIKEFNEFEFQFFFSELYDKNNVILELYSGVGGIELQDWGFMFFRMYIRWGECCGFKVEMFDYFLGDEVGIKLVILLIKGYNVYGYFKVEKGVYCFVWILLFDLLGCCYIFFVLCEVMFEFNDEIDIDICMEDIKVDMYCVSGVGGQYVNMMDLVVWIIYLLMNVVVMC